MILARHTYYPTAQIAKIISADDSSFSRPTPAEAQQARAAGVQVWGGYLATVVRNGAFGLASPWDRASFAVCQDAGLLCIGFCSGNDDPRAIRSLALAWNVLPMLDCEFGIRGDGLWVPDWLSLSGSGLYGPMSVHHWSAPYRIVASYPGFDPHATWPATPEPTEPHGWQWEGTHSQFGVSIDSSYLSDSFLGLWNVPLSDEEIAQEVREWYRIGGLREPESPTARQTWIDNWKSMGPEAAHDAFFTSPEIAANETDLRQMLADYRAGKLGGSTAYIPHTHTSTTDSGKPQ